MGGGMWGVGGAHKVATSEPMSNRGGESSNAATRLLLWTTDPSMRSCTDVYSWLWSRSERQGQAVGESSTHTLHITEWVICSLMGALFSWHRAAGGKNAKSVTLTVTLTSPLRPEAENNYTLNMFKKHKPDISCPSLPSCVHITASSWAASLGWDSFCLLLPLMLF